MSVLRSKPILSYCGITVILSNPSRLDRTKLLSANGGDLLNTHCLRPEFNIMQCDVRVADDNSPLLEGTKVLLLLGERAMHTYLPQTKGNTLGEMRGSVMKGPHGIWCVASYFPQDACDRRNLEAKYNPLSENYAPDAEDERDDEDDFDAVKKHGKTSRSNYAFWLRADCRKAKLIAKSDGKLPLPVWEQTEPTYKIFPSSTEVVNVLLNTKNTTLFFDIETDYEEQNLQCFAFSFDGHVIYSIPILDYNYRPAYADYYHIISALAVAIRDNILIAHNGAAFDFFVLGFKYRIPVVRCWDTMLAHHRCFPTVEKSLGHCTSYWTWQVFHKDEDSVGYMTQTQMMARLRYCGKDVYTMFLIYSAINDYAPRVPGLARSIENVMSCIRPYLITSIQGIRVDAIKVREAAKENDRLMMHYEQLAKILVGDNALNTIRSGIKGKVSFFCSSGTQQVKYFHEMLGYDVVARSDKTKAPSLGKKAMYKLALKYPNNPVIQLILAYRKIQKEYGTYKFVPLWDDNGRPGTKSILEYDTNTTQPTDSAQATLPI